jgi:YHS domain-containing protein
MQTKMMMTAVLLGISIMSLPSQDNTVVRKKHFNLDEKGIAIKGYDPVAYFKVNKAVKGNKEISHLHQGVLYYFSNTINKEEFKSNPSKYEPEYGGWCAYAMGVKGDKVSIDPETFKIVDNRLYLFYNRFFNNTLKSWNNNEAVLKKQADIYWTTIFQ